MCKLPKYVAKCVFAAPHGGCVLYIFRQFAYTPGNSIHQPFSYFFQAQTRWWCIFYGVPICALCASHSVTNSSKFSNCIAFNIAMLRQACNKVVMFRMPRNATLGPKKIFGNVQKTNLTGNETHQFYIYIQEGFAQTAALGVSVRSEGGFTTKLQRK